VVPHEGADGGERLELAHVEPGVLPDERRPPLPVEAAVVLRHVLVNQLRLDAEDLLGRHGPQRRDSDFVAPLRGKKGV
jgi:hypothetical protein